MHIATVLSGKIYLSFCSYVFCWENISCKLGRLVGAIPLIWRSDFWYWKQEIHFLLQFSFRLIVNFSNGVSFPSILDNQVLMYVPGQMCTLLMVISSCLNHVKNDIIYVWIFNLWYVLVSTQLQISASMFNTSVWLRWKFYKGLQYQDLGGMLRGQCWN